MILDRASVVNCCQFMAQAGQYLACPLLGNRLGPILYAAQLLSRAARQIAECGLGHFLTFPYLLDNLSQCFNLHINTAICWASSSSSASTIVRTVIVR